jgi:hypothetical protein
MPGFQPTIMVFYWIYLLVIAVFLILFLMDLYHLLRFGFFSIVNVSVIVVFALVAVWLLLFSFQVLSGFNWNLPLFDSSIFGSFLGGLAGGFSWFNFK